MIPLTQKLDLREHRLADPDCVPTPRLAAAAWSRLAEPGDLTAGALVRAVGHGPALAWVLAARGEAAHRRRSVAALAAHVDIDDAGKRNLLRALERWEPRLDGLDPQRDLEHLHNLGGHLVLPGTPDWPIALEDLGNARPHCLWVRGPLLQDQDGAGPLNRSVALVGARAATDYGVEVTHDLATGLADNGFVVISGGAYGIDAAAHRGALAAGGRTAAVLASGVDRMYPAGNARLLSAIIENGALISEVPPCSVPSRRRFLQRNRLIAALASATVVVEAAWRSGALNTATHASTLLRPLGAVPGPITSMASAGTHRLLREHGAVCVTDAAEVAELAGTLGQDLAPHRHTIEAEYDNLSQTARAVYDALPIRGTATPDSLARAAGLATSDVLSGLGELELAGIATTEPGGWKRRTEPGAASAGEKMNQF